MTTRITDESLRIRETGYVDRDVDAEIADLANHDVAPEVIEASHNAARLRSLTTCNNHVRGVFSDKLNTFLGQVARLNDRQVKTRLQTLFDQAYHYDPHTHLMEVANAHAKIELDIYIAALGQAAMRNRPFLNTLRNSHEINQLIHLASGRLTPEHRGLFYELQQGQVTTEEFATALFRARVSETNVYSGASGFQTLTTSPQAQSFTELNFLLDGYFSHNSQQRVDVLGAAQAFSSPNLEQTAHRWVLDDFYRNMVSVSDDVLTREYVAISTDFSHCEDEAQRRILNRKLTLLDFIATQKGFDIGLRYLILAGIPNTEAATLNTCQVVNQTPNHLDDLYCIQEATPPLRAYAQSFLVNPALGATDATLSLRGATWTSLFGSLEGREHFGEIFRAEAVRVISPRRPFTWQSLIDLPHHPDATTIISRTDLDRNMQTRMHQISLSPTQNLYNYVWQIADRIVIVPDRDYLYSADQAGGHNDPLTRTIYLTASAASREVSFFSIVAHEAAHMYAFYYYRNLGIPPEHTLLPSERFANLVESSVWQVMAAAYEAYNDLSDFARSQFRKCERVIEEANRSLELETRNRDPIYWQEDWAQLSPDLLASNPSDILRRESRVQWDRLVLDQLREYSTADNAYIRTQIRLLDTGSRQAHTNPGQTFHYEGDDAFLRFINQTRSRFHQPTPTEVRFTPSSWVLFWSEMGARFEQAL